MGGKNGKYGVIIHFTGQTEVTQFRRRIHIYEDNIKMGLEKIRCNYI
jgi:hypothetical protein